ncbi:MAG: DeoR/GlpR transcriptional regulator, partial [Bacteroidetes bacterium]
MSAQMLKEERQGFILDSLRSRGKALTTELSESLQVSEDTIRRDLKELADLSLVKKVHGGAVLQSTAPFHYHEREIFSHEEKIRLAEKAASELIRPGQVILMDGGTTNVELARRFAPDLKA